MLHALRWKELNRRLDEADFWLFELSVWLHVIAKTLVFVFIPLLLYRVGFSINDIVFFFVVFFAIDIPLNLAMPPLVRSCGARFVLGLSAFFAIIYFVLLSLLTPNDWVMFITIAVCAALYDVTYWVSHLFLFVESNRQNPQTDKNTGILFSVKQIAGMIGPIIGGGILIFASDITLYTTAIVIFVLSLIPLIRVDDYADTPLANDWTFRKFFCHVRERKNYISVALYGIHRGIEVVIWPLFIFVTIGTIESVALVPVILAGTTILFTLVSGSRSVSFRGAMITVGALLLAGVWILRLVVVNDFIIYFSVFCVGLFQLLISIPLNADVFERALATDPLSAVTYRNMFSVFGQLVVFSILLVLLNVFHVSFLLAAFTLLVLGGVNGLFILREQLFHGDEQVIRARPHRNLEEYA